MYPVVRALLLSLHLLAIEATPNNIELLLNEKLESEETRKSFVLFCVRGEEPARQCVKEFHRFWS